MTKDFNFSFHFFSFLCADLLLLSCVLCMSFFSLLSSTATITTLINFTLLFQGSVIKFSRTKSTELIAYLIYKNGSSVNTKELISVLWGDSAKSSRYGSSFRNLIVDIKHTLHELEIQNFFVAEYNNFRINPEVIKCDYYDFLAGNTESLKTFAGEFMSQYSWAEEVTGFLEMKSTGR